jgi:hypothetical protein
VRDSGATTRLQVQNSIMDLFYSKLKPTTQTGEETIEKLVSQVANCTLLPDRRSAVLGLKGMSRDWKLVNY